MEFGVLYFYNPAAPDILFEDIDLYGKHITVLLDMISPKLKSADAVQRSFYKISPSGYGIHWPLIDEDLSVAAILKQFGA